MGILNRLVNSMRKSLFGDNRINSSEDFTLLLIKERGRADRTNSRFSLIIFDIQAFSNPELQRLLAFSRKSIRISDDLGWFDERHIALMLPNTSVKGAEIIANKISAHQAASNLHMPFSILSYPSKHWHQRHSGVAQESETPLPTLFDPENDTPVWVSAVHVMKES